MRKINKLDCFTYAGAAKVLGISVWRVRYAVDSGYVPGPGVVFKRRPMFAPKQIARMKAYFARETAELNEAELGGMSTKAVNEETERFDRIGSSRNGRSRNDLCD